MNRAGDPVARARKAAIESAMMTDPARPELRQAYIETLWSMIRADFGPVWVNLPELRAPLLLRGGTSDIGNLNQIFFNRFADAAGPFLYGDYGFAMDEPDYILDLGAYCGYAAAYLANRFPRAKIIAVEPPGPNFDALRVNTVAYPNVVCLPAAVWHERTRLQLGGHLLGDWGTFFTGAADAGADGLVDAYTIGDILAKFGWDHVDYVKCVVEGAQVEILAGADRPWLSRVGTVSTRPPTGVWPNPDDEARLFAAFPEAVFTGMTFGELAVFRRRTGGAGGAAVHPVRLLPSLPDARPYTLHNVGEDVFRFYRFDHGGLQLAPNEPDTPAAAIAFPLTLHGHSRFVCQVSADAVDGRRVNCHLAVRRADGQTVVTATMTLTDPAVVEWLVTFPPLTGAHQLVLSVEQAGGPSEWSATAARFIDPRLL